MSQMATPGVVLAKKKIVKKFRKKFRKKLRKKLRKYSIYLVLYGQI